MLDLIWLTLEAIILIFIGWKCRGFYERLK